MTLSASFTVNGVANPAAHSAAYASTVALALDSTTGAGTILWQVIACSKSGASLPSITRAGTPNGATASFVLPSDPGDGLGRSYLVKCSVADSRTTVVEYAVVGAVNAAGILPIVPGEENARDATHGWSQTVNQALASTATPVPTTLGTPVADIAALKAVNASDRVDNQSRAVGLPAQVWIYSSGTGANFASDDLTVVKPTDVLLASSGRWYPASPSAVVPTISALRLAVAGSLSTIHVQSFASKGDGGGRTFDLDEADTTSSDNTYTIVVSGSKRHKARDVITIDIRWGGAVPGSVSTAQARTNRQAINQAITVAAASGVSEVYVPGAFQIAAEAVPTTAADGSIVGASGVFLVGDSYQTSGITHQTTGYDVYVGTNVSNGGAKRIGIHGAQKCHGVHFTTTTFSEHPSFEACQVDGFGEAGRACTAVTATDLFSTTGAHGFVAGDAVQFDAVVGALGTFCSFDPSANTVTITGHGQDNNDPIAFNDFGGGIAGGLSGFTTYYVKNRTANTAELSLTPGGATIDITTAGAAAVYPMGILPGGIDGRLIYYVIASGLTATDFKVSATPGGSAVDVTSLPSSGMTVARVFGGIYFDSSGGGLQFSAHLTRNIIDGGGSRLGDGGARHCLLQRFTSGSGAFVHTVAHAGEFANCRRAWSIEAGEFHGVDVHAYQVMSGCGGAVAIYGNGSYCLRLKNTRLESLHVIDKLVYLTASTYASTIEGSRIAQNYTIADLGVGNTIELGVLGGAYDSRGIPTTFPGGLYQDTIASKTGGTTGVTVDGVKLGAAKGLLLPAGQYIRTTGGATGIRRPDDSQYIALFGVGGSGDGWQGNANNYDFYELSGATKFLGLSSTGAVFRDSIQLNGTRGKISSGAATPNGNVTGSVGDLYTWTGGGAGTTLWVKESGTATNSGWVSK